MFRLTQSHHHVVLLIYTPNMQVTWDFFQGFFTLFLFIVCLFSMVLAPYLVGITRPTKVLNIVYNYTHTCIYSCI